MAVAVLAPMAAASRRTLAEVPADAMHTIYFRNTHKDYAGKAVAPGGETVNFHAFREQSWSGKPRAARSGKKRRARSCAGAAAPSAPGTRLSAAPPCCGAGSALSTAPPLDGSSVSTCAPSAASTATTPPQWGRLTTYSVDFFEPGDSGGQLDRDFREHAAACGRGVRVEAPPIANFETSYGGLCSDSKRAVPGGLTAPLFEKDNAVRVLIAPGAGIDKCPKLSFAKSQHRAHPKEAIIAPAAFPPQHNLGVVAQATDFFVSESQRNYTSPPDPRQALSRTSSAPVGLGIGAGQLRAVTEDLGPDRVLRRKMMRSEYGQSIDHTAAATAQWRRPRRPRGR